jgi:hypothetical protein
MVHGFGVFGSWYLALVLASWFFLSSFASLASFAVAAFSQDPGTPAWSDLNRKM